MLSNKLKDIVKANRLFLIYFFISLAVFSLWLIAFWPGIMSLDSLDTWSQVINGHYTNWHPYVYSLYLNVISYFYRSPAAISIFQITVSSLIAAFGFGFLYKKSTDKKAVFLGFFLLLSSIPVGMYNITIWKDVIFSQLVVFWGLLIFYLIRQKIVLDNKYITLLLGLLLFFSSSVRHNGPVLLLLVPLFFFLNKIITKKSFLLLVTTAFSCYILSQTVLPTVFNVNMKNNGLLFQSTKIQIVSSILASNSYVPAQFSTAPISKFYNLLPESTIKANYDCMSVNPLIFNKDINKKILEDKSFVVDLNKIFIKLTLNNLPLAVADRSCVVTSIITGSGGSTAYYNVLDYKNPYPKFKDNLGIKQNVNRDLKNLFVSIIKYTTRFPHNLLFYSLLIPLTTFLIGVFYVRKDRASFNYFLFVLLQLPVLLVLLPGPDFRYLYFLHFAFFFTIPMIYDALTNKQRRVKLL